MLDKKRGYAESRPFYSVDTGVNIHAGMVAFLTSVAGVATATIGASGHVPIGTFWKDRAATYIRTTIETKTFSLLGIITLSKGNILSTGDIKVTNSTGTVVYTNGADYLVNTTNGVITRGAGLIPALATVIIWYKYSLLATQIYWDNVSTKWTASGQNYDRQPDDTLGSGKITVAEGLVKLYTDQYDVTRTYTLNQALYSNVNSMWTNAGGFTSAIGRVLSVPSASDPFLGLQQITVVA